MDLHRALGAFGARQPRAAVLWAATALASTIVTSQVVQAVTRPETTNPRSVATSLLVLAAALLLFRAPTERAAPWMVLAPLFGVAAVVVLDLLSHDAGVTGVVFFVVPVVYAAALLRAGAVALVCAATAAGTAVVSVRLLPLDEAVVQVAYLTVLVVLVAGVLGRAAAQNERAVQRLRLLADLDPLTGLATRRVLDAATGALAGAHRPGSGALVLVDLDRFKAVNDTYGHQGGDAALTHVASILRSSCRGEDVAARMGGDELAVLLVGCGADDASRRAQHVVDLVRDSPLVLPDGRSVSLSVSVGVASVDERARSAEELYARADAALYEAKRSGRDRAVTAAA